ncbi:MAG: DinB family protein [Planctomycetota bacterium]|jgi:hypothetical protein
MLVDAMKRQFNNAFAMLEAAVPSFSADQWRREAPSHMGPARLTMHVLQCAEFYTSGDESVWRNFGKRVWEISEAEAPSQERLLEYLADAWSRTLAWLDSIGEERFTGGCARPEFVNNLDYAAYALRHLQHHIGEICAYQKQFGLAAADWK